MIIPHSHSPGTKPETAVPVTARDLWALAGYTAFAGVLLAPLRHYVGKPKQVRRAKFKHDSFPLSTYPMFSADRKGRIIVPHGPVGSIRFVNRSPAEYAAAMQQPSLNATQIP